jgi:hypothetical protein
MKTSRERPLPAKLLPAIVAAMAVAALAMPSRAWCQSAEPLVRAAVGQGSDPTTEGADAAAADKAAAAVPGAKKTLKQKVKAIVSKLTPDRLKRDIEFKTASQTFPNFCQHWGQNLQDRETNNLTKLAFAIKDGFHTATYTGYGKISGCEAHQSKDGYSIGKITYEEFIYYVVGKTRDEARHATPKPISDTHTTEIFRWENNKWFY